MSWKQKNIFFRALSRLCKKYLKFYNDFSYDFYKNGEYDLLKTLSKFSFKTVFDVGGNVGEWSQEAGRLFPDAKIHTFELSKQTFQTLSQRLVTKNFVLNNIGLSECSGKFTYKDYGVNAGVNTLLLNADYHDDKITPTLVEGEVSTGDEYCEEAAVSHIDFLKVDVEGAESLVLSGFRNMLSSQSIRVVQFEYGYTNGDAKFLMRDFYEFFEALNYRVGRVGKGSIDFSEWTYEKNDFNSGPNYIAIKKDDAELFEALQ